MLSFRAGFITEFCFDWLPQMAAIKKIVQLLLISSIGSAKFISQVQLSVRSRVQEGTKPISRKGYGPGW